MLAMGMVTVACEQQAPKKEDTFKKLYNETMDVHDATMGKMHTMSELQARVGDLRAQDSLNAGFKVAQDDLNIAQKHMMQWMRDFSLEFPYDEHPENIVKDKSEPEVKKIIGRLQDFKTEIDQVDREIKTGIEKAEAVVK